MFTSRRSYPTWVRALGLLILIIILILGVSALKERTAWATVDGLIRGSVSDDLLQPIPGATVTLRNLRSEATSPALYQSDDSAQSWLRFNSALVLDTVNAIAFDPGTVSIAGTTRIYAGGADFAPIGQAPTAYRGGVHRSLDGGLTWQAADNLLPLPAGGPAATGPRPATNLRLVK